MGRLKTIIETDAGTQVQNHPPGYERMIRLKRRELAAEYCARLDLDFNHFRQRSDGTGTEIIPLMEAAIDKGGLMAEYEAELKRRGL